MLLEKIESVALDAPFAVKREDIQDGDIVKIISDAQKQPDRYNPGKMQTIIKIMTRNGERYISLSQTSINILINTFKSNDASTWIGKEAKILLKPSVIGGKKVIVAYLTGMEWELDEYGSPFKSGQIEDTTQLETNNSPIKENEVIKDDINLSEVPFE